MTRFFIISGLGSLSLLLLCICNYRIEYSRKLINHIKQEILETEIENIKEEMKNDVTKKIESLKEDLKKSNQEITNYGKVFLKNLRLELFKNLQQNISNIRQEVDKTFENLKIWRNREIMQQIKKDTFNSQPKLTNIKNDVQNLCNAYMKLPPRQKLISYSVFGTRDLYYQGIPIVLQEVEKSSLYKDWYIRIYHDTHIKPEIKEKYKSKNLLFCDVTKLPGYGNITDIAGLLWRTVPLADPSVDVTCIRDLDSALLPREEDAVRDWLKSEKLLHTMRDNPQHMVPILGGMWCFRSGLNATLGKQFLEQIFRRSKEKEWDNDQPLLEEVIYNALDKKDMLQHDSYLCMKYEGSVPFPTQRKNKTEFVGCPGHICNWPNLTKCPVQCRPKDNQDWEYC